MSASILQVSWIANRSSHFSYFFFCSNNESALQSFLRETVASFWRPNKASGTRHPLCWWPSLRAAGGPHDGRLDPPEASRNPQRWTLALCVIPPIDETVAADKDRYIRIPWRNTIFTMGSGKRPHTSRTSTLQQVVTRKLYSQHLLLKYWGTLLWFCVEVLKNWSVHT